MLDIGMGEFLGLAVVALLVLGPDKLPRFAADAARFLRQLRRMAHTAREDVRRELGPELKGISLDDLNPRSMLRSHLDLDSDDDEPIDEGGREAKRPARAGEGGAVVAPPYDPDAT